MKLSENIESIYQQATIEEYAAGMVWYYQANGYARFLSNKYSSVSLEQSIGVIAALSPRNKWTRNIIDAEILISHYHTKGVDDNIYNCKSATFNANKNKAIAILHEGFKNQLGGLKVNNFYRCISNPLGQDVCIDGHAICIALGSRKVGITASDKNYLLIAAEYVDTAQKLDLVPSQLQAITWVTYRRLHNITV